MKVELIGNTEVAEKLRDLGRDLKDLTWFWPHAKEVFTEDEFSWFSAEGEGTWPELSEPYGSVKERSYGDLPILVLTGDMRGELTGEDGDPVLFEGLDELWLGSSMPYSGFHYTGTLNMPARNPLAPTDRIAGNLSVRLLDELFRLPYFGIPGP